MEINQSSSSNSSELGQKVSRFLVEAREKANRGDEPGARNYLSTLDQWGYRGDLEITPEVKEEIVHIRRMANRNAFDINVSQAESFAKEGEVAKMESRLAEALYNASIAGMQITPEVQARFDRITKNGHANAVWVRVASADEGAHIGHVAHVESCFSEIKRHLKVAGLAMPPEILRKFEGILKVAHKRAITNALADAQRYAYQGDKEKSSSYLGLAMWHANRASTRLDEQQEAKYLEVLKVLIDRDR